MESQPVESSSSPAADDVSVVKEMRQQLQERIESRRAEQHALLSSLQCLVPDLVSTLDLSLRLISAFHHRPFVPTPPLPPRAPLVRPPPPHHSPTRAAAPTLHLLPDSSSSDHQPHPSSDPDRLLAVRTAVAVCLLERVPFSAIDSAALLRKLEGDHSSATPAEKTALVELGGEDGPVSAIELALRRIAEENGGVELDELMVGGKSRIMVLGIDRSRLLKELPETAQQNHPQQQQQQQQQQQEQEEEELVDGGGVLVPRPSTPPPEMWMGPAGGEGQMPNGMRPPPPPHMFGPMAGMGGGGPRGMGLIGGVPRGMIGAPPLQGPSLAAGGQSATAGNAKPRTEEDDIKDLEALLSKKSFMEMQKSKTGEELLDLIHRPTAKETAVAAKFKTKGGSQVKEYCPNLTKEDCRRQLGSYVACDKVHFRRIIAPHTDVSLGDCSFLDTCRHMKTCKYVHYELDPTPDVPPMMGDGNLPPPKPVKAQRAEYCSEVELGEPQWINCDIRTFRMDILGQFGVIMADPPWDIHMELPYGTMADDEMRNLNVPALQTDGLIFLWVTGRAMELGRECLELWGYKRVEEIIWVKTNQLQRIIRTGRTGHWLNHSKEHCLVGIKGSPEVNRNIDTDVIVAEVRETSRKPDEMYPMLERISPRTRKLELFARMHNTHAGWLSLGNQLNGVRLVDEGLRARFRAAYPDIEVQPPSPPRSYSTMDADSNAEQKKSPLVSLDSKQSSQYADSTQPEVYASEEKHVVAEDAEMTA